MSPAELADLTCLSRFPKSAKDLIALMGLRVTAKLISAWPAREFPVPLVAGGGNAQGERRWRQLVAVVGETAARRIQRHWAGDRLYIPSCHEAIMQRREDSIRAEYDQLTYCPELGGQGLAHYEAVWELCTRYGASDRAIEKAVGRPNNPVPSGVWEQFSLI